MPNGGSSDSDLPEEIAESAKKIADENLRDKAVENEISEWEQKGEEEGRQLDNVENLVKNLMLKAEETEKLQLESRLENIESILNQLLKK